MAAAHEVEGLNQFRRDLAKAGEQFPAELKKVHAEVAIPVAGKAAGIAASSGSRMQQWAAIAIWGRGTATGAAIGVRNTAQVPFAIAALMGSDRHTGWYADPKYDASAGHQFPDWVGNAWEPGGPGGPRAINPAIAASLPEIEARYGLALDELGHRAGFR